MSLMLAMWCCEGFECIQDITNFHPELWEQQRTIDLLKGTPIQSNPLQRQLFAMQMRARVNGQRNYELYTFRADDHITEDDLWGWANNDPQTLVDWIRKNGDRHGGSMPPPPRDTKRIV